MRCESLQPELGASLRRLRRERRLKLADVSEATGISASFLSLVESGKNDVTVSRLARLCEYYGVGVGDVLPLPAAGQEGVLHRGEHQRFLSPAEAIDISVLGNGRSIALYRLDFEPGAQTTEQIPSPSERILLVLGGKVEVLLDEPEPVLLEEGDTYLLRADRRHGYRNPDGEQPACLLVSVARRAAPAS